MMDKVHVYMCLHTASIKSTAGNKIRPFPSPFHISTSWHLILGATVESKLGGYVTVPCPSRVTQPNSTADWLKF